MMKPIVVLTIVGGAFTLGAHVDGKILSRPARGKVDADVTYQQLNLRRDAALLTLPDGERASEAQRLLPSHLKAFIYVEAGFHARKTSRGVPKRYRLRPLQNILQLGGKMPFNSA